MKVLVVVIKFTQLDILSHTTFTIVSVCDCYMY